jgi:hypothetical protein
MKKLIETLQLVFEFGKQRKEKKQFLLLSFSSCPGNIFVNSLALGVAT